MFGCRSQRGPDAAPLAVECVSPGTGQPPEPLRPSHPLRIHALNGPKGSLVGRRGAADHRAHGPSMNPATSPLKSRRRTLQGVLRERLPQIEATLRAGYRMQTIVEQLAQAGQSGVVPRTPRKTYGPLNLPPGDPPSVTSTWDVEAPPPQAVPRPRPAAPVVTPEDLRKRAGFQYEGTANLNKDDLV